MKLATLPAEGYDGEAPKFPLQSMVVIVEYFEDRSKVRERDDAATESFRERESALWEWAWSLPQAAAWAREPWRWHTVAMWVRTAVICEGSEATAADKNSLHRFADQIGLTPAGLRENGWTISADEVAEKRAESVEEPEDDPRTRLMVVSNGGA